MRLRRRRALKPLFARAICHSLILGRRSGPQNRGFTPCARPTETGLITRLVLVRQELLDLLLLGLVDHLGAAQAALALGGLVAEEVALVRLLVLEVALGGHLEALLGARMGLHLRHVRDPFTWLL